MKTKIQTSILFLAISLGLFAQSVTISPNKASAGQTFAVTILGKNTAFLTGVNTIDFVVSSKITPDAIFTNQTVVNDSVITGTVTISNTIPNPYGFSLRISNTINPPINLLSGISIPDADTIIPRLYPVSILGSLNLGGGGYFKIGGKNTHLATAKNNIIKFYKYGVESNNISISNIMVEPTLIPYELRVYVIIDIKTKPGFYAISIENEIDGKLFIDSAFAITNPNAMLINSIDHRYAKRNEVKDVYMIGVGTQFKTNPPTILFTKNNIISKEIEVVSITAQNDANATVRLNVKPTAEMGNYNIAYFYPSDLDTMYLKNYFAILAAAGTNEIAENTTKIFPNPAKNLLNIESKNVISSIHIFDLMGKEILNKTLEKSTQNLQLDLTQIEIPKGIYFIKVQSLEGVVTQKIVIE
ncbi:MAG: T9SS type A sorting domain-containing protein [Bacteroidia bacterium]